MKIVIIGNGIAGATAALEIRKHSDAEILMVSDECSFPYSRPSLMYIFMGHLPFENTKLYEDLFWTEQKIELIQDVVAELNIQGKFIKLETGNVTNYDKLIIATGSVPNKFGWPGQELEGVQNLYRLQDLQKMEAAYSKGITSAVIVGGGLIGIEVAEMLHSRHIDVTMIVREASFWDNVLPAEESEMINKHIEKQGIKLLLKNELASINGTTEVESVSLKDQVKLNSNLVFLTVGVRPKIDLTKGTDIEINKGILVNEYLQTNLKDIYAIGDCAEIKFPIEKRKSIEAVWYTAKEMGRTVAINILNSNIKKYNPGLWYNSAKFFDIEYQIYGTVPTQYDEKTKSLFWQHPTEEKSIRIVYDNASKNVLGFNLMGIRYRQEVCLKWIENNYPIEQVLTHLSLANFDPEFFDQYEQSLCDQYNKHYNTSIKWEGKRNLTLVNKFLKKIKSYAQS